MAHPIFSSLPTHNPFSSLPTTSPPPSQPPSQPTSYSPPIPIPKYTPKKQTKKLTTTPSKTHNKNHHPAFTKIPHNKTKYFKPISHHHDRHQDDHDHDDDHDDRTIIMDESGVSYLLPGAPFEYKFSYSETPKAKPIAIRDPPFLPFAPPSMPRPWTGKAPLKSKEEKLRKKKIPLVDSFNPTNPNMRGVKRVEMPGPLKMGEFPKDGRTREEILGEPLSKAEIKAMVKPMMNDNRQINLGNLMNLCYYLGIL